MTTPIIIEHGSGYCKAGFANDQESLVVFDSLYACDKKLNVTGASNKIYIGDSVRENKMLTPIKPIERGIIKNWEAMENIWSYVFHEKLKISPEDYPVMICEYPLNPKPVREKMVEILLETFKVPVLSLQKTPTLILQAMNINTGLVVDSGDGITLTVSVYEGCTLPQTANYIDFAGGDITDYLLKLMSERGYCRTANVEREEIRIMKEKLCKIPEHKEKKGGESSMKIEHISSNGKIYYMDDEMINCPEILFNLNLINWSSSIQEKLMDTVQKSDNDIQKRLLENIVLAGGNSNVNGFKKRLYNELKCLTNSHINIIQHDGKQEYLAYRGASMMAQLLEKQLYLSKDEYNEHGPSIVHRKFF